MVISQSNVDNPVICRFVSNSQLARPEMFMLKRNRFAGEYRMEGIVWVTKFEILNKCSPKTNKSACGEIMC